MGSTSTPCPEAPWQLAKRPGWPACVAIAVLAVSPAASAKRTFAVVDPPGSTATRVQSINNAGTIAGYYQDAESMKHGFLRTIDGTYAGDQARIIDVSARGESRAWHVNDGGLGELEVLGMNGRGVLTGFYTDYDSILRHGFIYDPNGPGDHFDVPGYNDTVPVAINRKGDVVGYCNVPKYRVEQAFLRRANGTFTVFHGPGITETYPVAINNKGWIVGNYQDELNASHAFLRE